MSTRKAARSTIRKTVNKKAVSSVAAELDAANESEAAKAEAGHWLQEIAEDKHHLDSLSTRICTLDQLLKKAKVDLDVWEVERHVINQWEVGAKGPDKKIVVRPLFQIKAWLRKKTAWSPDEFRKKLLAEMKAVAPSFKTVKAVKRKASGLLYELSIFDHHVGKLCWAPETGNNYDLKIAGESYMQAVEDLLSRVEGMPLDGILFPIGNDFLHTDNAAGTTTKGTKQDCDGRWQLQFVHARRMITSAIDRLREIAPVEVVVVPGNHDGERMFYLGDTVESWFRRDTRVTVNNGPASRKYKLHGIVLLGFTHGDKEKHSELPRLMADEVPELWAKSRHREIHHGHFHKSKETQWVTTDTLGKTILRCLPSLSGVDAWHSQNGYGSPRGSEAYLWSSEHGYRGHFYYANKDAA